MNSNALISKAKVAGWRGSVAGLLLGLARPMVGMGLFLGRLSSWLVLAVMAAVLLTVAMNALGVNEIASWDRTILLFGNSITINSITELQWHLFGLLILSGSSYALHNNIHVRVDMLHSQMSDTLKNWVEIVGHLLFLIPFCLIIAWLSRHMVEMSYISGERSSYGGLTDRYLIKAALPIGLVLLSVGAVGEILYRLAYIADPGCQRDKEGRDVG